MAGKHENDVIFGIRIEVWNQKGQRGGKRNLDMWRRVKGNTRSALGQRPQICVIYGLSYLFPKIFKLTEVFLIIAIKYKMV